MSEENTKKVAVLSPKKLPDGRWQVSLGITVENGRRTNPRRQFKTRADALEFCNTEKRRKKAHGEITANADGVKVAQWMKLDARMDAAGVRLSDVERWIQLHARLSDAGAGSLKDVCSRALEDALSVQCRGTVGQCYEAWAKWLKTQKRRGRYRSNARNFCANFIHGDFAYRPVEEDQEADEEIQVEVRINSDGEGDNEEEEKGWKGFGADRQMIEITPTAMKSYLPHHPGYFGVLSAWFGWSTKNGWLPRNPCIGLKPSAPETTGVATFTTKQVETLLRKAAKSEDWAALSYLAISLFGGVRPEEFRKVAKGDQIVALRWEDYASGCISISPDLAKTRRGRIIEAEPVLVKWVNFIGKKMGSLSGAILPANWIKDWRAWRQKHWSGKWPQDVLRHTYGSHHLARSQSLEITSRVMGNSAAVLDRYYWNWQTRTKDASAYWALNPDKVLKD
ncbi:MAG: hypothetical protein DVB25_02765 [Verrucomicrobia bacterium]|nr:MAG: hypothetical protein DVB25_02765 [Verrucomicrobiota bacterium]